MRPYRLLIENNLPGIMAAHVVFPAVDALPASLSRRWITEVCAASWGFTAASFADDLSMAGAAAFGDVERARLACRGLRRPAHLQRPASGAVAVLEHFDPGGVGSPASQARLVRMRARGEAPANLSRSAVAADGGAHRESFGAAAAGADGGQS
jgi:beta-N-acetylhexosaminidase